MEFFRMQAMGKIVDGFRDTTRAIQRVLDERDRFNLEFASGAPNELQIYCEQCQLLADIVMEFTGNLCSLVLLGHEQPASEVANPIVTGAQSCLAAPRLCLGLPPSHALCEQQPDQG